ncbi:anti-phage BREX system Lon protease BrxL [Streptomyces sp. NPDC096191]|uniref:anti-phage BREX system Lon protease BrxL n=1 Tax=Streptomyces sp. NPDC096191 TaxID=3155426 RepID=UPI003330D57A
MSEVSEVSQEAAVSPDARTGATPVQSELDRKINRLFPGAVVRKDLVKAVKGNAIVPSYVLEYLLGQYAASDDEATIQAGIDRDCCMIG